MRVVLLLGAEVAAVTILHWKLYGDLRTPHPEHSDSTFMLWLSLTVNPATIQCYPQYPA